MTKQPKAFFNRRARYDYELDRPIIAGIALLGIEVKGIRLGRLNITGAFVDIKNDQMWLKNMRIDFQAGHNSTNQIDDIRNRQLLVTKRQLKQLTEAKGQGKTIVPLEVIAGKYIKLKIAAGRGRRKIDKRNLLKQRSQTKEIRKHLK